MSITSDSHRSKIFILINCIDGKTDYVLEQIRKIDEVTQVQKTDGAYDLIAILEANSNDEIKKTLMHKIRTIDDVKYTLTLRSSLDNEV